jgi:hypothetical protein
MANEQSGTFFSKTGRKGNPGLGKKVLCVRNLMELFDVRSS